MKQIFTIIRNLSLALILTGTFANRAEAQFLCNVQMAAESNPANPMMYNFSAYMTGDSSCLGMNPQYTWTIYGNPNITLAGSNVSFTFSNPGLYMVCVQASFQGMVTNNCDTIVVQNGLNCTPSFVSNVQGLTASLALSSMVPSNCFDSNTNYYWSFGDSTYTTQVGNASTSHTYAAPGTYTVCLTALTSSGLSYNTCASVTVTSQQTQFTMGGMVLAGGACMQEPVLVEVYGLGNNYYQSMTVNGGPDSCYYWLQTPLTTMPAQYIIRATPMTNPNYIPTYFGDVLFWGDATLVTPMENLWNLHINLLPNIYDTIPGLGTVSGTVTGNGVTVNAVINGQSVNTVFNTDGCRVIVLNASNQPVGFAFVNANGTFSFTNLPAGDYFLRVDNPKIPSASIPFSINGNSNATVNFAASTSGIAVVTNTANQKKRESIELWPNPAGEFLSLNGLAGEISIVNAQGKTVLTTSENKQINLNSLPSGIYQISGKSSSGKSLSARFIKK